MNERSTLLRSSSGKEDSCRSTPTAVWKAAAASFVVGVFSTLLVVAMTTTTMTSPRVDNAMSMESVPMLGAKYKSPALHFFKNASTDFASTLPPLPPNLDDSFLADLATSTDNHKPITSGFYRQEAGEELVYEYTYHEMKFIVAGEFHISDSQGNAVGATAGDVFYFPKGSIITFSSPSFGLGFFCGQRPTGDA